MVTTPPNTDVEIKNATDRFYYSVRAIIKQGDKYLVMQVTNPDGSKSSIHYPGGHVEIGEEAEQAIIREVREEVGCELKDVKLFAFLQNFWEHAGKRGHGIELFFLATPQNPISTQDYIKIENDKGITKKLEFKWFTAEQLKTVHVRPSIIKELIIAGKTNQTHYLTQRP